MKICFVGPASSAHIKKWCNWFAANGHEIHVISFAPGEIEKVTIHHIAVDVDANGSDIEKLKYLFTGKKIKTIIEDIKPDIVNVHYATSYGVATALSGIKGYILSVWGSDIYEFPRKSFAHRVLLKYSLKKAVRLFSTSKAMADEAAKYTNRSFDITPFGVDVELFSPCKRTRHTDLPFIIGTVKGLSDKYGIRDILEAASIIKKQGVPIELRIAGKGPQEDEYRNLANELGISDITKWLGFISQKSAAIEWANMDVAIIPSIEESFGVSAVEAQSCGTPVIISDIPGLKEATKPEETSIVVKRNSSYEIADAVKRLYINKDYREKMGKEGRKYVLENYEINKCFQKIQVLFEEITHNTYFAS